MSLNQLAEDYLPLLNAIETILGSILFGGLSVYFLWKSNLISSKKRLTQTERDIFNSNYDKIIKAQTLIIQNAYVNNEAHDILWRVRNEARLNLLSDIQEYVDEIFHKMHEAYIIHSLHLYGDSSLPVGEERNKYVKKHSKLVDFLMSTRPHEKYNKYLKIDLD